MGSEQGGATTELIVVALGASAGGIEALKAFFGAMPAQNGMAFVVVQHLAAGHESHMADILARCTSMKVVQARDGMVIEPHVVYTNPPGVTIETRDHRLVVAGPAEHSPGGGAIDRFLFSLAEDWGADAVSIILSGSTGTDGPLGVRAVRAAGGVCMAQDPASAQFDAMPRAVIDTGLADYIQPPAAMPAALLAFAQHARAADAAGPGADESGEGDLETILGLLRAFAKIDYRPYKRSTVMRRIRRRMGLRQTASLRAYARQLQDDAQELALLAKDMLIGVSSFFRDADVFETLRTQVILPLVQARSSDVPLRAWVVGCATGEEAYSVAMVLLDVCVEAGKLCPIKVFATDIDEQALEFARAGSYPARIESEVGQARLARFFERRGDRYVVNRQLREAVILSRHNVMTDPPFSRQDLISCRNVMIYFDADAQRKATSVFSFALNVGGCLVLGESEGISGMQNLFEPVSQSGRIYRLTRANRKAAGELPPYPAPPIRQAAGHEHGISDSQALAMVNMEAILQQFAACSLIIEPQGRIVYFHGQTEKYLGHPEGPASPNMLEMADGVLSLKLREAIEEAIAQNKPVSIGRVSLAHNGQAPVNVTVTPVDRSGGGRLLAVIFEDARDAVPAAPEQAARGGDASRVAQLDAENKALRHDLRTHAQRYRFANEELKSLNEEMMSMNEELQSANEELTASKEEMQSINEELTTVNGQLNEKVQELTSTTNDLANLLAATEIATIFLDAQTRIKRFTARATELLNLIGSDAGRPVSHITQNFSGLDLAADAQAVLRSLQPLEKEVQTAEGRWFTVRIRPYRTLDNRIDGTVVTFSDVTRLRQVADELGRSNRDLEQFAHVAAHDLQEPLRMIASFLGLLRERSEAKFDAKDREYINFAVDGAERMKTLIRDLLEYARVGGSELARAPVSLEAVLEATLINLRRGIEETGAAVTHDPLPTVVADGHQVQRVLQNLIANALKFRAARPPTIHLAAAQQPGNLWLVSVRDNGIGMEPANAGRIFEIFARLHGRQEYEGTGMGLAICRRIIQRHGGRIWAESEPGKGSTFFFTLPG